MSAAYKIVPPSASDAFSASRAMFEELVMQVSSSRALAVGHAEVESALVEAGRGLLNRLFQDHLDLRSAREKRVDVVDDKGNRLSERRSSKRTLRSLLGPVLVRRFLYQAPGNDGRAPADAGLRLAEDGFSMGVRKEIARLCAADAYASAAATMERLTGAHVAQRQAEELTMRSSADVEAFYRDLAPEPVPDEALLVLSFDAAGIVMRPESLRAATRKKAEREVVDKAFPPKIKSGEKPNRKRMAQVGAIYAIAPFVRTSADILGELKSASANADPANALTPRPRRPRPINKRLRASVTKKAADVIDGVFREASARDPEHRRRWVVLVDGNGDQIRAVHRAARRAGVNVTIVADLIHLIEYLWRAAYCFHPAGSDGAREWVVERIQALLEGADPSQVAAGIRRSATLRQLENRGAVDRCAHYILELSPYMRYGAALRDGLPIATGIIEGACRHLVRRRLDIGGARWSTEGAEAVLLLRAVVLSGDFDAYWSFHERHVYHRAHERRYFGPVPETRPALRRVK